MATVVPQHENKDIFHCRLENQVIRKRPEVSPAQMQKRASECMKSLWIFLNGGAQAIKFFLKLGRGWQPGLFLIVT